MTKTLELTVSKYR